MKIIKNPLVPLIAILVLLTISMLIHWTFYTPKYRTDWNKELNHQRDSIIRELKKEGVQRY